MVDVKLLTVGGVKSEGVALDEDAEALDVPVPFVAVEENVYAVPFVRPVTTQDPDAPETVHVLVTPPT